MAKKTRTELSTSAINTNLPDNTQELITPTTERAQLTDERESVVNYKDDLGGLSNAGKFLTVAVDGESLTMVDAPTGDVTGTGVQYQVAVWDGTNSLTGNAAFQFLTGAQNSIKLIRGTGSGNILFYAADGTTLHGYIENQVSGNGLTIGQQDGSTSAVIDLDDSTITFKTNNNPRLTISSGGAATFSGIVSINGEGFFRGYYRGNLRIQGGTTATEIRNNANNSSLLTILNGGNVGIGTDDPQDKLEIKSGYLRMFDPSSDANAGYPIRWASNNGGTNVTYANITGITTSSGNRTGDLVFSTSSGGAPTEKMRISSGGDVLIGKTVANNDDVGLWFNPDGASWVTQSDTYCLGLNRKGTDGIVVLFTNDQATAGTISVSGTTTAYNTSSDYRLKENVTPITDALSRLNQLKPSRFNFIADTDKIVDGFIAHEVQDIIPEAICGEKDAMKDEEYEVTPRVEEVLDEEGNVITEAVEAVMETRSVPDYQGIDQSKIVPLLTAAIQEQQTIIETLITRLEALEA